MLEDKKMLIQKNKEKISKKEITENIVIFIAITFVLSVIIYFFGEDISFFTSHFLT